jgi:sugar/nucleoside kinase (ribokinase family)
MSKRIVSIGDLVLDIVMPVRLPVEPGQHQDVSLRRIEPGGAGNFMIAARHMGLEVSAAGTVGADPFGAQILDMLRAEDVHIAHVVSIPSSTSTVVMVLTDQQSGEHTFVGSYGTGGEVPYPAGLDATIAQVDALFLQGYTLSEKRIVPMAFRAVERAAAEGIPIYLDVGPFMAFVTPENNRRILSCASVLLMTEDEIPLVAGEHTGTSAYDYLLSLGPRVLVIKQGAQGCTIVSPQGTQRVSGFQVPVVDTVGAGDCFDAAFLAGHLNQLPLWECGRLANAMGATTVQRMGAGRNAPTYAEVIALLKQAGDFIDLGY